MKIKHIAFHVVIRWGVADWYCGQSQGTGSLVKAGLELVNLLGTNSYAGNTTVSIGTLVFNAPLLQSPKKG